MNYFKEEKHLFQIEPKNIDSINIALCFPNTYMIGMTSLGYQTAWKVLNQHTGVNTLRWFTDAKESRRDTINCVPDYLGFSFSWELDYINIFKILEDNNIPLLKKDRNESHPLIFCGGQVANANPELFSEVFDFFLLGDLEILGLRFLEKIVEVKDLKKNKNLEALSSLEGVYCPQNNVGKINFVPPKAKNDLAFSSTLTQHSYWPNTFVVEVVRSCPELCRFCLASYGSLPFRTPEVSKLIEICDFGLQYTNKIGLLGASVTQHPDFEKLIEHLVLIHKSTPLHVQIASVRADTISKNLAENLSALGIKSVTMAIESGSEKLRKIINKKVSNETIKNSIQTLYDSGIASVKLYGMVGLPFEDDNDLKETVKLLKEIKEKNKYKKLSFGCSVFVPKAGTPFQIYGIDKNADKKLVFYKKEFLKFGVDFRPESYKWALIQALISRGDKTVLSLLISAYTYGGTLGAFNKAIREFNATNLIKTDKFIFETWDYKERFPWDNIDGYLKKELIEKQNSSA